MSMYRFTGTLKEIVSSPTNKTLKFTPDQECSVVVKSGKDESKFVVFLPVNGKNILSSNDTGIVFTYSEHIGFCFGDSKQEWLPSWKCKWHYEIVIEVVEKATGKSVGETPDATNLATSENPDVTVIITEVAGSPKQFRLVSIVEME